MQDSEISKLSYFPERNSSEDEINKAPEQPLITADLIQHHSGMSDLILRRLDLCVYAVIKNHNVNTAIECVGGVKNKIKIILQPFCSEQSGYLIAYIKER